MQINNFSTRPLLTRSVARTQALESSPPPPGFEVADAADGSIRPTSPSFLRRRLESNNISLVVMRHGQSQSNADSDVAGTPLLYGQSESPLTQKGRDQAKKCAEDFYNRMGGEAFVRQCIDKPEKLPVFISSSVGRAMETSQTIVDYLKDRIRDIGGDSAYAALAPQLTVEAEPRLRETNFGSYEKKPMTDVERDYPDFIHSWRPPEGLGTDFLHKFPGGESRADLMVRTSAVMDGVVRRFPGRTVVLLSHSECILGARTALGLAPVQDGKTRAETSTIANATPYWVVGNAPSPATTNFGTLGSIQNF